MCTGPDRGGTYSFEQKKKLRLRRLVEVSSVCDGNWGLSPLSNGLRRDICLLIAMPAAPCVSRGGFMFSLGREARMICWMVWSGLREGNGRVVWTLTLSRHHFRET